MLQERGIGRSMLISADQAHGWHPNSQGRHEEAHRPAFHGGVVVKINHNQRYATTSTTHAILKVYYSLLLPFPPNHDF